MTDDPSTTQPLNIGSPKASEKSSNPLRENPYVGPRALREGERIFGRDRELRELLNGLIADRIVLLYSPSGAGKTSLVQAGLIPMMRKEKFTVLPTVRVGLEPPAELSSQVQIDRSTDHETNGFNRYIYSAFLALEQDLPSDQQITASELTGLSFNDYLAQRPRGPNEPSSRLLIFDQFEEILTHAPLDREGKLAFFEQIGETLLDHDLWALFVIREDFLAGLDPYLPLVPTYLRSTFRLDLLESQPALLAIKKPVSDQGITFNDKAASKLVDDLCRIWVQQPDGSQREELGLYVEPVQLQVVCRRLYKELDLDEDFKKSVITEADIAHLGDVNKALGEYYGSELSDIATRKGIPERDIRDWFGERLITENLLRGQVLMGEGTSGGMDNEVIRLLEDAHLMRAENRRNSTWFELAHDRLVRPILEDNQAWAETHLQEFQRRAAEWRKKNRSPSLLLRGRDLVKVEEWVQANPTGMNAIDWELVEASRGRRTRHLSLTQRKAAEWQQQGRPEGLLLNETELIQAETWLKEQPDEAAPSEIDYIDASRDAVLREARLKQERELQLDFERQRTKDQELQNQTLRRRNVWLAALAVLATLVFLVALYYAYQFNSLADENAARAGEQSTLAANNARGATEIAQDRDSIAAQAAKLEQENDQSQKMAQALLATSDALAVQSMENFLGRATAEHNAALAQVSRLASLANNADEPLSDLLSIAAYHAFPQSWEGRNALLTDLGFIPRHYARSIDDPFGTGMDTVRALTFSPDGNLLAWCGSDGEVKVWDLEQQTLVFDQVDFQEDTVTTLTFSPVDSNLLVSGTNNGYLTFWDLSTGTGQSQEAYFRGTGGLIYRVGQFYSLAFSPGGDSLAVSGSNGNAMIWDVYQRNAVSLIDLANAPVRKLDWSPDGKWLALAANHVSGGVVYFWEPISGELVNEFPSQDEQIFALDWSPNGEWLAVAGGARGNPRYTHSVILYNPHTQKQIEIDRVSNLNIYMLAFDQDSKILAVGGQSSYYSGGLGLFDISQASTSGFVARIRESFYRYNKGRDLQSLAFAPKGPNRLAYLTSYNGIEIVEIGLIRPLNALIAPASNRLYEPVQPNPDMTPISGLLALGFGSDTDVRSLTKKNNFMTLSSIGSNNAITLPGEEILSIALGQGDLVTTGDESGRVQVRNFETRTDIWVLNIDAPVVSLALSQANNTLAVGWCRDCSRQDFRISVYGFGSNEPLFGLKSPNQITSLVFSWDGNIIAGGGLDGRIQLWDARTQKPLGSAIVWDQVADVRSDQIGAITALAFSRDGTTMASGDQYGHLALWDLESRRKIAQTVLVAEAPVTGLLFSSDGLNLTSAAQDGSIQRWDLDPELWIERLCELADRDFTSEELEAYGVQPVCKKPLTQATMTPGP